MNRKIGKWNVPLQVLLLFYDYTAQYFEELADGFIWGKNRNIAVAGTPQPIARTAQPAETVQTVAGTSQPVAGTAQPVAVTAQPVIIKPRVGNKSIVVMGSAMVFSILCCITSARIEKRRIGVIISHGLLEKPDDDIPMSVFWLLFQFFLLAWLDSFFKRSLNAFYADQAPGSMKAYLNHLTSGVYGLGFMSSVLSVYVVGRISERGGKANWFQFTLNKSRLDKYYWVLAVMIAVNFIIFVVVAWFYRFKENVTNPYGKKEE